MSINCIKHSKKLLFLLIYIIISFSLGVAIGFSPLLAFALFIPLILYLLIRPNIALSVFIACVPLEFIFQNEILSLPKITGLIAFLSYIFYIFRNKIRIIWDSALTFMVLFILFGIISIFWTINLPYTLTSLSTYLLLTILYFLIINLIKSKTDLDQLMVFLLIGSLILILSALIQWYELGFSDTTRISGLSLNSNYLGTLMFLALLSIYWILINKNRFIKFVALFGLISTFFCILSSQSRGSVISFSLLGILFLLTSRKKYQAIIILIIIAFIFFRFGSDDLWSRFLMIGNETGVDRFRDLWPLGIELIKNNPLIGYGLGTNGLAIGSLFLRNLSVHNGILAVLIDTGLIGLILYLGFIISAIIHPIRSYFNYRLKENRIYLFLQFLLISLISYFTIWIKSGGAEYDKVLWILLGLVAVIPPILKKSIMIQNPQ